MVLKKRWVYLLKDILSESAQIQGLKEKYNISERTFRNDLNDIDRYLTENHIPKLVRSKEKGLYIDVSDLVKDQLWKQIESADVEEYALDSEERVKYLFFLLLLEDNPISSEYIANKMGFSRNTLVEDIKKLEENLKTQQLKNHIEGIDAEAVNINLIKKRKIGIYLETSEFQRRQLYIDLFVKYFNIGKLQFYTGEVKGFDKNLHPIIRTELNELFLDLDMEELRDYLDKLQNILKIKYSDISMNIFILAIALGKKRNKTDKTMYLPMFHIETLKLSKEYRALKEIQDLKRDVFPEDDNEIAYLAMYLLSNKILEREGDFLFEEKVEGLNEITNHMIDIFEFEMQIKLSELERDKLFKGLKLHLEPAIYRMRYNICISNKILEDIQKRYKKYYDIAGKACMYLSQQLHVIVPEEEVGFIALYFGGIIEGKKRDKIKVLLICHAGLATVRILEKQILERFENIEIIGAISHSEYISKTFENCDLVISTVELSKSISNSVVVNSLLEEEDINKLKNYLTEKIVVTETKVDIESVLGIVKKYSHIYAEDKLKLELENFFERGQTKLPKLSEKLNEGNIFLNQEADSWEEAVKIGTKQMITSRVIETSYETKVIENIKKYKAYVVLKKGVAIPHAKSEDGANELGISLITLKKGVCFGHPKNDPVSIIFIFASSDEFSHLTILETFMNIIKKEENIEILKNCKTKTEVLDRVKEWEEIC